MRLRNQSEKNLFFQKDRNIILEGLAGYKYDILIKLMDNKQIHHFDL